MLFRIKFPLQQYISYSRHLNFVPTYEIGRHSDFLPFLKIGDFGGWMWMWSKNFFWTQKFLRVSIIGLGLSWLWTNLRREYKVFLLWSYFLSSFETSFEIQVTEEIFYLQRTTQLKNMLYSSDLEFLMEAHNGIAAKIIQEAGIAFAVVVVVWTVEAYSEFPSDI